LQRRSSQDLLRLHRNPQLDLFTSVMASDHALGMPRVRSAFHSSAATFGCVYLFEPGGSTAACLQANQPLRAVIEIHLEWAHLSLLSTEVVAALMRSAAALCCGREAAGCVAATTFSRVTCTFACISALPT
jgi:hypothetical protein